MTFLSAPPFLLCTNNDTVPSLNFGNSGHPPNGFPGRSSRTTVHFQDWMLCILHRRHIRVNTRCHFDEIFFIMRLPSRKNLEQACKIPLLPVGYPCPEKEFQDQFRNYIFSPAFSSQKTLCTPPSLGWRNRQTQRTQNPPEATPWGFDSPSEHQLISHLKKNSVVIHI